MARIRWVEEREASGPIGEVYAAWMADNPGRTAIPGILKALSLRPELFTGMDEVSDVIHFRDGHLDLRTKEMMATYVSALNRCAYCTESHAAFLRTEDPNPDLYGALGRADIEAAPLTPAERGLLDFAALITQHSHRTTDADVEGLRELGWTDPQIAEAVYIAALFAFFNRVANAFGLEEAGYLSRSIADTPRPRPLKAREQEGPASAPSATS